ncbi:MAG TPA: HAD hydrolase-like protein [Brevefilum fermentans]|uniref:Haloacid dehalogenase domain protein hydrolase n=1 Tax=Candidatus Brevifilum fermentans TaxID=1986204 RepID=A0A1Y6K3Z9_9CHLR|nr:HAD hydrolase-like protein [Brevefilum fermentans]MDI9565704.1 HAD hydrolase-like protein [Chloroflexota bacterium]SMX54442.1 Haloacid dehalogenase domain protein hydrolase [Brevefilum fermentans]HQA29538.1 HAD hydrolase-like protein [Brevefilum fermentans]
MLNQNSIEIITPGIPQGTIKFALFDFDGTISLIREGWQQIMIPMMVEILLSTPRHENREEIEQVVRAYVAKTTGKQTIYQMIRLAEEVELRGGTPEDPLTYKQRYHDLLMERIIHRLDGLREGKIQPNDLMVPGALNALKQVTQDGIVCFLASGTDENYVFDEANLLEVDHFFQGIYGAQDNYESFSKRMVIQKIIQENHLSGPELIAFGDGYVEIEDTKAAGGIAIGLATDEANRSGVDEWKRDRLIASGADVIMPDFKSFSQLWDYLMPLE